MRKIIVSEFVTLDGVMEAPGTEQGFERSGWNIPYMNDQAVQFKIEELKKGDLLLGKTTFDGFKAFWPKSHLGELSELMNGVIKYVAAASPLEAAELEAWQHSEQLQGDVPAALAELKKEPNDREIVVYGSGVLVQTLIQHNLVDEYRLLVHPVILGKGQKLFQDGLDTKKLRLMSTETFDTGLVLLTYTTA